MRSRTRLIQAAIELLSEKPSAQITVAMVVRQAKVSRPTLYQHFGDLSGLFLETASQELHNVLPDVSNQGALVGWEDWTTALFARLRESRQFFLNLANGPVGLDVLHAVAAFLSHRWQTMWWQEQQAAGAVPLPAAAKEGARMSPDPTADVTGEGTQYPQDLPMYIGYGMAGLVAGWLQEEPTEENSPSSMGQRFTALLNFAAHRGE